MKKYSTLTKKFFFTHIWSHCCFLIFLFLLSSLSFFSFLSRVLSFVFFFSHFSSTLLERKLPHKYLTLLCKQGSLYHESKKAKGLHIIQPKLVRNRAFPAMSVNKDVAVISDCSPPVWAGESERRSGRISVIQRPSDCSHSLQ